MSSFQRQTLSHIGVKAFLYLLTGVLLFYANLYIVGWNVALRQTVGIVGTSSVLFAGTLVSNFIYLRLMTRGGKSVMGFYLSIKLIRLLFAVSAVVGYAVLNGSDLPVFAINLFVLYLVGGGLSLLHYAKMERILKRNLADNVKE